MALTLAEQNELDALNSGISDLEDEKKGQKAVAAYQQETQRPAGPAAPFSIWRSTVGGFRDAFQGTFDSLDSIESWFDNSLYGGNVPELYIGGKAPNGIIGFSNSTEAANRKTVNLDPLKGQENAGTAEKVTRGIVSFAVPFTGWMKAFRGLSALGKLGSVARGVAAGMATDFTQLDPYSGNIANVLKDGFGLDNKALDALASSKDDGELEARFKASVAGAGAGLVGDALFGAGSRVAKLYREWRGTAEEASAVVDNIKQGAVKLEPVDNAAAHGSDNVPVVEADQVIHPSDTPAKQAEPITMVEGKPVETFDDVVDFLKSKAGDPNVDSELFQRVAKNLLEGDPENALAKLGIDPAKLDFSLYTDPALLGRLQKGLTDVYEQIAQGLGRTGTRVTEQQLVRGAEALASTPDVLRDLYGATSGLGEQLMAARMFVGAHAHQLLDSAQAALRELEQGGTGPAWDAFLEAFHRHAYFLGAVRGAGSEVARALKSLQFLAKSKSTAKSVMDTALKAEDKVAPTSAGRALAVQQGASAYADRLVTDADKIGALTKLIGLKGDVAELSRTVREENGSTLKAVSKRLNAALKETTGSLFSTATAVYNVGAGVTYMGLNTLGRYMAAIVRTPGILMGGQAELRARAAWVEAWAYSDGIISGFSEAYRNTLAVLEHEAYSELSLNLDGMGLTKWAKEARVKSAKGGASADLHFERADVVNNKAFSLTGSEAQRLRDLTEQFGGPQFFQAGLRGLVNVLGASINSVGSAFRSGTTLFINLPDEFVGTLATRAGAYSKAVRIAAGEASELGLEGAQLGQYLKARTVQLFGDGPKGWSTNGFEDGAQVAIARAGQQEAKAVLFQDDLELGLNRAMARGVNAGGGLASIFIPFIKTPLRIIERTAIDYTPLGLFKSRIRSALLEGGAARDEALARMSLGLTAMYTAYNLAGDRTIVGQDGGFLSTARDAGRPSYSLKIGADSYEFSRLDPIGTLLGIGADLREYEQSKEDDPNAEGGMGEFAEAMLWGIAANVLSKTWLTSVRQLTDLAGATSPEDASSRWDNFTKGLATRFIPASGIQRQLEAWGDGQLRAAADFGDGLRKASIGAGSLPARRDIVGRPLKMESMTEVAGVRGGILPDPALDPLGAELENLSMRKPAAARTQKGVVLDAQQYARFLDLRGHETVGPNTGLTLEQALNELVRMPEYKSLPPAARAKQIQLAMDGYNSLAVEALTNEDHNFALARLRVEVFDQATLNGWDHTQRDATLKAEADRLGIPHN